MMPFNEEWPPWIHRSSLSASAASSPPLSTQPSRNWRRVHRARHPDAGIPALGGRSPMGPMSAGSLVGQHCPVPRGDQLAHLPDVRLGRLRRAGRGAGVLPLPENALRVGLALILLLMIWVPPSIWLRDRRSLSCRWGCAYLSRHHPWAGRAASGRPDPAPMTKGALPARLPSACSRATSLRCWATARSASTSPFVPHIIVATAVGFAGAWAGKRINHRIGDGFRLVFRLIVNVVALRLLWQAARRSSLFEAQSLRTDRTAAPETA